MRNNGAGTALDQPTDRTQMTPSTLTGVGVSPGRGAGPVVVVLPPAPPAATATEEPPEAARQRISAAGLKVRAQLERVEIGRASCRERV